jgi:hypothetical protein
MRAPLTAKRRVVCRLRSTGGWPNGWNASLPSWRGRLYAIASQWSKICDELANDRTWEPSSVDALSGAALAQLLIVLSARAG